MGVATIANETGSLVRGKTTAEDSLGLVLLQRGNFFDDHNIMSITLSTVFINLSSVVRVLWITPSSIGPKLIRATLD